jgi:hypothetical protein
MKRYVSIDDGVVVAQVIGDGTMPNAHVPDGRVCLDVTDRPDAVLGSTFSGTPPLVDDWTWNGDGDPPPQVRARTWTARDSDVFTPPPAPPRSTRVAKTAFLGVIPPALYKAWATSTDDQLMLAKAVFDADTSVDVSSPIIAQVLTRALQLAVIDAPTAAQLQAAIAALVA